MSYKYKIQEIAEMMADDDGKDYFDLSPNQQNSYYKKAYEEYLDRMADRADSMRKNEAGGGFMRQGYAMGTDDDEIPEVEEMPTDEYLDLLKSIGADKEQASGIRSLDNRMASDDNNERLLEQLYEQFLEEGLSPEEAAKAARQRMMDMGMKRKAPSIKMADVDPMLLEEYLKYVDEMREMELEPMSLREFEAQARAGLKVGGLASII
jgi:hypothetical protein|tara:strand:+ start:635 stop:1258 length:624 start_codon:yes stop_codon:yes gene_type:complete